MMRRVVLAIAVVALAVAPLSRLVDLAEAAPQGITTAKQPIYLKCTAARSGKTHLLVTVFNNTTKVIPKGTKINWLIGRGAEGSFTLETQGPPGKALKRFLVGFNPQPEPPYPDPEPWAGKAWYYGS